MSNSNSTMSGPSSSKEFCLKLPTDDDARVTVYDGHDKVLWTGSGKRQIWLPRGLYTVRMERNRQMAEQIVRLVKNTDLSDLAPVRFTAAPLWSTALTHEYYADTSRQLSQRLAHSAIGSHLEPHGEVFIFFRAIDEKHAAALKRPIGKDIELRDEAGSFVTDLNNIDVAADPQFGWLAIHLRLSAGHYRLTDMGEAPRQMAVHVFPGWQTQLFVLWTDRPILEGARMFARHLQTGFSADDEITQATDLATEALASGSGRLPHRAREILFNNKFDDPFLGLIGAYTELGRLARVVPSARDEEWKQSQKLLNIVIANLADLLGPSPDVTALRVIMAELFDTPLPVDPSRHLPMFRAGFEAFVRASSATSNAVVEAEDLDDVAANLFTDSIWTTWRPFEAGVRYFAFRGDTEVYIHELGNPARVEIEGASDDEQASGTDDETHFEVESTEIREKFEPNWIQSCFLSVLNNEQARLNRADEKNAQPNVDTMSLAAQLRVTPRAIERAVAQLDKLSEESVRALVDRDWPWVTSAVDFKRRRSFSAFLEKSHQSHEVSL